MKLKLLAFFTFSLFAFGNMVAQDLCAPVGWATQNGGTTGGGNATPTVVTTYAALQTALASTSVKVVHISGSITFPANGRINIQDQSGKTIIGLPGAKLTSVDLTASGSGIFYVKRCTNIIFRNIIFVGPGAYDADGNDNMTIDDCQNVWVDHCEFHDAMDGNLDIKNMADFISVTWCKFSYEKAPIPGGPGGADDHRFSNLFGSSDGATGDRGTLRITMQYCWWAEGCVERMPRIRFGKVHMVNNYFSSSVAHHGIRAGFEADILAEGNYFVSGYKLPVDEYNGDYTAILARNNSGAANITKGTAFTPPYTIAVAAPANIVTPIQTCTGATLPSPTACSSCQNGNTNKVPTVSITSPANNATFTAPASITINATAADTDGTIAKVEFYNGTTLLNTDATSAYTYAWTNVAAGTYTIKAIAYDDKGATATATITVTVTGTTSNNAPTVSITSPANNATFTEPASIVINATAADTDGSIASVAFYNGTTLLGSDNATPYTYNIASLIAGTYTIKAIATDNLGATATATITVVVNPGANGSPATLAKHGSGSASQTITIGQAIVDFNYTWTNATNVTVTGMPNGIVTDINTGTSTVSFTGTPTQTGTFQFTITTVGGNPDAVKTGSITVNVVTGLEDADKETNAVVFPNPFTDQFTLAINGEYEYMLLNSEGVELKSGKENKAIQLGAELNAGFYFLKLNKGTTSKVYKITKK